MKLAAVLTAHPDRADVVADTIDSVRAYVTDDVLCVVDGVAWGRYESLPLPCAKLQGFPHGRPRAPYRNVALGLATLAESHPDADWYLLLDYDCLVGSDRFKRSLEQAAAKGVWMLGNDGHVDEHGLPLVQALLGEPLRSCYYLLGCAQFLHRDFLAKLRTIDFFDRFLTLTSGFAPGDFPFYGGYDLSEHLYPSLCRHFGGHVGVFASYERDGTWHGASRQYPCRWRPEITADEGFTDACLLHPVKDMSGPVRTYYRDKRQRWNDSQKKARSSALSSTCRCATSKAAVSSTASAPPSSG